MAQITAKEVLDRFRGKFIDAVDANVIVHELAHQKIIIQRDLKDITKNSDATEQNEMLHACLLKACDEEALMKVCEIIVQRGYPKMRALGKEMKSMLEGSVPASQPQAQGQGQAQGQAPQTRLDSSVADRAEHLILFRTYVSKNAAGKARAVLEGVGLDTPTIDACFSANPLKDEAAVQDGLTRWKGGKGTQPPTWGVLIGAMEYAEIAQQDIAALKKKLGL